MSLECESGTEERQNSIKDRERERAGKALGQGRRLKSARKMGGMGCQKLVIYRGCVRLSSVRGIASVASGLCQRDSRGEPIASLCLKAFFFLILLRKFDDVAR